MSGQAEVTVGIDIGTTSVKAVAVSAAGEVVARSRVRHPLIADADRLRHDAARAWRSGPRRALAALVSELGDVRPRAASVSAMVPSLAAVDRRGRPISPGLLYGDASAGQGQRSGPDLTGDAPRFLGELARAFPDARGYWPAQSTAVVALGGPPVLASGAAIVLYPLVDNGVWSPTVLDGCGIGADRLPSLVPDHTAVAEVDGMLLDGGDIDVRCESIVSGATEVGDALVICGSTLIVIVRLPGDAKPTEAVLAFPDGTGAITATGASNAGALFLDWVDRTVPKSKATAASERVPVWVPYIRGERTPWQDPSRRASLHDLHLGHDPAAVRRAAYEASGFVVRHMLELMDASPRRLVAVAGGTRSPGWMQALADCTQIPVDAATESEGAAIGAAFHARMTAGLETDLADAARWARPVRRVQPDAEWAGPTDQRYKRFRELVG